MAGSLHKGKENKENNNVAHNDKARAREVSGRCARRDHQHRRGRPRASHRAGLVHLRSRRGSSDDGQDVAEGARRFSLCAQTETSPYKYVSVEGPVVAIESADLERDLRPLAHGYLGTAAGDRYMETTREDPGYRDNVLVRMRPERWLTVDFAKAVAPS
jgi:hypothetical protein